MYQSKLNIIETQEAIQAIKDSFSIVMCRQLNVRKIPGPEFLNLSDSLNDNLAENINGVTFNPAHLSEEQEIVQSLAKWKRMALRKYQYPVHTGICVDMRAIRKAETLDSTHSLLVDQWDWEIVINRDDYNFDTVKRVINKFFFCLKSTEDYINLCYSELSDKLPDSVFFITSEELYKMYPDKTASEREYLITKEKKCVFVSQVGGIISGSNGQIHDVRAKDYDNLELNGDLLVYHAVNDIALELMSMGIRVDREALIRQKQLNLEESESFPLYYKEILNEHLPLSIGGGIGQSRLAMFFLEKAHIGEVQVSSWDKEYLEELAKKNIYLL